MTNQDPKRPLQSRKKASIIFFTYLFSYIVAFSITVYEIGSSMKEPVWFYFAMGIGSIYVLLAFYSFYDNYLQPYITDLEKIAAAEYENEGRKDQQIVLSSRSVYFWTLEWIVPALLVKFLVVVFFWMTVSEVPFKQDIYTQPFMLGQIYEKMNNYMSPEIVAAGFSKELEGINSDKEKKTIMESAQFLEAA